MQSYINQYFISHYDTSDNTAIWQDISNGAEIT